MRLKTRHRAVIACACAGVLFTGFSARLVYLQVGKHEEFTAAAAQKHSMKETIVARRGLITDRGGEVLAANVPVRKVILDSTHVAKPGELARLAAPYLDIDEATLEKEMRSGTRYRVLSRTLAEEKAAELRRKMSDASLRGLYFREETTRSYPNRTMLSHVLGFLGRKDLNAESTIGIEGIERSMEHELCGQDGFRHIERDRTGREIVVYRGAEQAPRNGNTVELTIDMGLQAILEAELDTAFSELKPTTATAVIADPHTGEILAMASRPTFDPEFLGESKDEEKKNRAIMDVLEPGSTFKIVVASAALNERVVNDKTKIFCENGSFFYGGRILKDVHGYGQMGVFDILVKSSNIGSAKMALMLGEDKYYEYVRGFGFGEKTGVNLPGEVAGILQPPQRWDKLTITRMPMGHAIAVTPLQLTMAMSVIANGGKLMRPQIVRAVRDPSGDIIHSVKPEVVREVIPQETARFVSSALAAVTRQGGTARLADVPGFSVAGKTGTAQKVDPKGGYAPGEYVVSFIGYLPAEDPAFVCLVLIDDAKVTGGLNYGGVLAAPVFARIAEKSARYMNLVPTMKAEAVLPVAFNQNGTQAAGTER